MSDPPVGFQKKSSTKDNYLGKLQRNFCLPKACYNIYLETPCRKIFDTRVVFSLCAFFLHTLELLGI